MISSLVVGNFLSFLFQVSPYKEQMVLIFGIVCFAVSKY